MKLIRIKHDKNSTKSHCLNVYSSLFSLSYESIRKCSLQLWAGVCYYYASQKRRANNGTRKKKEEMRYDLGSGWCIKYILLAPPAVFLAWREHSYALGPQQHRWSSSSSLEKWGKHLDASRLFAYSVIVESREHSPNVVITNKFFI